jgi:hypothetical protein
MRPSPDGLPDGFDEPTQRATLDWRSAPAPADLGRKDDRETFPRKRFHGQLPGSHVTAEQQSDGMAAGSPDHGSRLDCGVR